MRYLMIAFFGFIVLAFVVLCSGCAPSTRYDSGIAPVSESVTVTKATDTVVRIVDREYNVICYFYADFEGGGALSCLPYYGE